MIPIAVFALILSGCATAVVGSITLGQISTAAGVASVGATGKGLPDHALSSVMGQDCRLLEGLVRSTRRVCEVPGSPATENDFRGVVVMLREFGDDTAPPFSQDAYTAGMSIQFAPTLIRTYGSRRNPHHSLPANQEFADARDAYAD